eukprot:jgi/Chlat1/5355/Chrsp35S05287
MASSSSSAGALLALLLCLCAAAAAHARNVHNDNNGGGYHGPNGGWRGKTPTRKLIELAGRRGPFVGIIVPNQYEAQYLLDNALVLNKKIPSIDFSGRRFYIGKVSGKSVVVAVTGLGMVNSALTTQAMLDNFAVEYVVLYGIAGSLDSSLKRNGDSVNTELPLEPFGDYSRHSTSAGVANTLNRFWHQAEELFQQGTGVDGAPPTRNHTFYYPVSSTLRAAAAAAASTVVLDRCVDEAAQTGCVPQQPAVHAEGVVTGTSANVFVDNAGWRQHLFEEFGAQLADMETVASLMVCTSNNVPFVAFRSLSDLAGGGSASANEINDFFAFASRNAVKFLTAFLALV